MCYRDLRIWCVAQKPQYGGKLLLAGFGSRQRCVERWNIVKRMRPKEWSLQFWQKMQGLPPDRGVVIECYGKYRTPKEARIILDNMRHQFPGCYIEDWT